MSDSDSRARSDGGSDRRNVVLVTVDSLRADHCSYWGYERETTPTLDAMASDGYVFEQAMAPGPSTYESMPAIFTGRLMCDYADQFDAETDGPGGRREYNVRANMNSQTLGEWFAERGYATAAFTPNPYTGRHTSFSRGFDRYEDFMGDGSTSVAGGLRDLPVASELDNLVAMMRRDRASKPWEEYYRRILDWIEEAPEPFFLWIFLMEPHTPYLVDDPKLQYRSKPEMYYHNWKLWLTKKWKVPPEVVSLDRRPLVDLYDMAIRSADDFLDRLLGDLSPADPVTVVHADHGEAFNEHGIYGHREYLYEENVHVPLVVHNAAFRGRSASPLPLTELPALLRTVATGRGSLPSGGLAVSRTLNPERVSIRSRSWKYVAAAPDGTGTVDDEEVFDLVDDPAEESDVVPESPRLVSGCRDLVRNVLQGEEERRRIARGVRENVET